MNESTERGSEGHFGSLKSTRRGPKAAPQRPDQCLGGLCDEEGETKSVFPKDGVERRCEKKRLGMSEGDLGSPKSMLPWASGGRTSDLPEHVPR